MKRFAAYVDSETDENIWETVEADRFCKVQVLVWNLTLLFLPVMLQKTGRQC